MTSIARLDPLRDLRGVRNAMNRLFDEAIGLPGASFSTLGSQDIDLYRTADEAVGRASLYGVSPKELNISITGDVLTLRGEAQAEDDVEGAQHHIRERRYAGFTPSIGLPTAVAADKPDALFENGILTLRLPKAEEVKPKAITVKAR